MSLSSLDSSHHADGASSSGWLTSPSLRLLVEDSYLFKTPLFHCVRVFMDNSFFLLVSHFQTRKDCSECGGYPLSRCPSFRHSPWASLASSLLGGQKPQSQFRTALSVRTASGPAPCLLWHLKKNTICLETTRKLALLCFTLLSWFYLHTIFFLLYYYYINVIFLFSYYSLAFL